MVVFCFVSGGINKTHGGMCYVSKMAAGTRTRVLKTKDTQAGGRAKQRRVDVHGSVGPGKQECGACREARGRTESKQRMRRYRVGTYRVGQECSHACGTNFNIGR
jgi:hypothetical protein